ncbi:Fasciclin-like arabinogalactan protein [Musa troglodytarum]|uniref:Fasciclin-like arabinogalactan protein n=1 Tax=Musa troglodytarum TaxID=320322 RepID=A0A9E7EN58_9LILI|nr:Fasciclin-like arabinogalactan protein [Musa troglodytarum]
MATQKDAAMFSSVLLVLVLLCGPWAGCRAHNITAILERYPEYSLYNSYLTRTKVCDEINAHETVTCLVLDDGAMSTLAAKRPLAAIKNALRLLALLDYFDPPKLHALPSGSTLTSTLLQTTGNEAGNLGFVNITNLRGGRVGFASTAPGSKFDSTYTKSIDKIPYNLSVLAVSAPIVFPGLFDTPTAASSNLTALLEKAGCKTFARLLTTSGVLKVFQDAMDKGLTLFAPNDEAFKATDAPDLNSLSSAELVTLLQYHALPSYTPKASLKSVSGRLPTMASSAAGKYDLSVVSRGDDVSLDTGVDTSRVASTVLDDTPVCILTVDNLLLPTELFGAAPSPAPTPSPSASPVEAPAPAPEAKAPSPKSHKKHHSPPAPPMASPESAPSDAPAAAADKADVKSAVGAATPIGTLATVAVVFATLAMASLP